MINQDFFAGVLLKIERIKQNKGQKEICYGICVPSYLSKIERNLVQPDEHILKQLFQRLGIKYCFEKEFIQSAEKLINEYFEGVFYGIDNKVFNKLQEMTNLLSYSPLALDWLLVQEYQKENDVDNIEISTLLKELEDVMTERQRALFYIIQPISIENPHETMTLYKKAHRILNNSYSLLNIINGYYKLGEYDKVNEYADQCITLALEEGNTLNLARCYGAKGDVYACLNLDTLMLPFYKRLINLLQNTNWINELPIVYYNIGATYLNSEKYEIAMEYLNKSTGMGDDFLLNHKKALVKIRNGHYEEAKEFLNIMEMWLLKKCAAHEEIQVEKLMYEEVIMEMQDDFLSNPDYLKKLENLMEVLKVRRHPGYYLFYINLLKKTYCKQRKYKKALELDNGIS